MGHVMRPAERADAMETERVYRPGDKDTPEELEELLRRVLSKHPENSTNPHYTALMNLLWDRCITLAPDEEIKIPLARLMFQEIEHGVITARILKHLGVDKVENPIEQYMFHLPIDSWVDLCYFHALGDRVGMYIGETWGEVPYEPLRKVTPKLHRDELFHASLGMSNLKICCKTESGRSEAQELIHKWWPACLDMFGKSTSKFSDKYVKWGIRKKGNEELRQDYIGHTRPMLEALGIDVPGNTANRRFL